MKTLNYFLAICFFVSMTSKVFSQENSSPTIETTKDSDEAYQALLRERWNKALGSFQIQIINSRISPQINVALIERIEEERDADKIVFFSLMENVRVMVLPYSVISGSYEKIELFNYIND